MMRKRILASAVAIAVAACATGPVERGERMPGGSASLACAERLLRTLEYEVSADERGAWVQGEHRAVRGPASAEREVIRIALAPRAQPSDPDEVLVEVRAFHYLPAMNPGPTRSQDVVEVAPGEDLVDDAALLRAECRGRDSG